jgi:hypothetical protein
MMALRFLEEDLLLHHPNEPLGSSQIALSPVDTAELSTRGVAPGRTRVTWMKAKFTARSKVRHT